jgi:hypothetical protein
MSPSRGVGCTWIQVAVILVLQLALIRLLTVRTGGTSRQVTTEGNGLVLSPWHVADQRHVGVSTKIIDEPQEFPVFTPDQPIPYPPCTVDEEAAEAFYHRWAMRRGSGSEGPSSPKGDRSGCVPGTVFTNMTFLNIPRSVAISFSGRKSTSVNGTTRVQQINRSSSLDHLFSHLPYAPVEGEPNEYISIVNAVSRWTKVDPYWMYPGIRGYPSPTPDKPTAVRRFKYGIIAPELRCPTNLWHGLYEDVLPIFDVMVRMGWHRTPGDVAILWPNVDKNGWGMYNAGCPAKSYYPHGLTNDTWMGRILFSMLNISANEEFTQRIFFVQQHQKGVGVQAWRELVAVDEVVPGNSRLCRAFRFPAEGGIRRSLSEYFPYQSPYYDAYSQHRYGPYCAALLESLSETVMRRETDFGLRTVEDVFTALKGLIRIAVVVRKGSKSGMGRRLINQQLLTEAIRREVGNNLPLVNCSNPEAVQDGAVGVCLEEVSLEHLSTREQLRLMQSTTIFVCARGAGSLNTMFLPYGATIIYLNIMDLGRPVKNDQLPWNPGLTFLPRRTTMVMNCRAVFSGECSKISVNFCDIHCNVSKAATLAVLALSQTVNRLQRHPLLGDGLRKASKPSLAATARRYGPYLQAGPFGSTYLLPLVEWRSYNYTVLQELRLTSLQNSTMEWFVSEDAQFGPDW